MAYVDRKTHFIAITLVEGMKTACGIPAPISLEWAAPDPSGWSAPVASLGVRCKGINSHVGPPRKRVTCRKCRRVARSRGSRP